MLGRVGAEGRVLYDGLDALAGLTSRPDLRSTVGLQTAGKNALRHLLQTRPARRRFLNHLRACDVVVVVDGLPHPFRRDGLRIEDLRLEIPDKPIVLFDLFYLATRGPWAKWIRDGNPGLGLPPGGFGLERFDWYLSASVVSEFPMPRAPQPLSIIGVDLDDGTLRVEPRDEFRALIDFEHPRDIHERALQILACEQTGTKFSVLNGDYSIERIREQYRKSSIFFLAMRESFGLPICEAQACGALIFTPHSDWQPAHWIKSDHGTPGPGTLSPNFIVYEDDLESLKREVLLRKAAYDPNQVFQTFLEHHPQYFRGDLDALRDFLTRVTTGEIHARRHEEHAGLLSDLMQEPIRPS